MIGIRPRMKMITFNRRIIKTNWKKINRGPLQEAGNRVRSIARGSIRRGRETKAGKRTPSVRPNPPKSWGKGRTPPFKMIFSLPFEYGSSVIVGMVGFGGGTLATPGAHEHGGFSRARVYPRKYGHRRQRGVKRPGKKRMRTIKYPKRAFMQPALDKVRLTLPHLWRGSVK